MQSPSPLVLASTVSHAVRDPGNQTTGLTSSTLGHFRAFVIEPREPLEIVSGSLDRGLPYPRGEPLDRLRRTRRLPWLRWHLPYSPYVFEAKYSVGYDVVREPL